MSGGGRLGLGLARLERMLFGTVGDVGEIWARCPTRVGLPPPTPTLTRTLTPTLTFRWRPPLGAGCATCSSATETWTRRCHTSPTCPMFSLCLRYISATSPVHHAQVRQFFEVAVSAAVLPVFGFPEVGPLDLPASPCISPHLPTSPQSPPYRRASPVSHLYLLISPHISHLACISQAGGLVAMLTPSDRRPPQARDTLT